MISMLAMYSAYDIRLRYYSVSLNILDMIMVNEIHLRMYRLINDMTMLDPEFFGTRVGCHVSAVEWV